MVSRLLELSLRQRMLIVVFSVLIAVGGIYAFQTIPIDAFPDTTPVQVQVNTAAPALSPLEVERQITRPIEWAISGLPGLAEVRSVSKF